MYWLEDRKGKINGADLKKVRQKEVIIFAILFWLNLVMLIMTVRIYHGLI